jgi:hypothetical protein
LEIELSVSELDTEDPGPSEGMDTSDEMLMSGVSMDIREARSENKDIVSESDMPDDERSESAEAARVRNRRCWVVWWCSASSWSITVRIVGVGIVGKHTITARIFKNPATEPIKLPEY